MTHQEILTSLTEKKAQLEHRISAIEADLHQGHRTLPNKRPKTRMMKC
jgi:BMFP domain-containing protein YqiC